MKNHCILKKVKYTLQLRNLTHVATKVHVILQSLVVSTWMPDAIELVYNVTLWNNTKET
jgi:hypothetical protein